MTPSLYAQLPDYSSPGAGVVCHTRVAAIVIPISAGVWNICVIRTDRMRNTHRVVNLLETYEIERTWFSQRDRVGNSLLPDQRRHISYHWGSTCFAQAPMRMELQTTSQKTSKTRRWVDGNTHQCNTYRKAGSLVFRWQMVWDVVDSLCIKNATLVLHEHKAIAIAIIFFSQMAILRFRHYIWVLILKVCTAKRRKNRCTSELRLEATRLQRPSRKMTTEQVLSRGSLSERNSSQLER